ncbi:MAG TPA: DUF4258 domain-containing protein [Candidatus Paceibacterota bacterium]
MKYFLTKHAKERMTERFIPERIIANAITNPTSILYDDNDRLLIKKLYRKRNKERLLLIAGEMIEDKLKIITVIDTSKINKYL